MQSSNIMVLNFMDYHKNLTFTLHVFIGKKFASSYQFFKVSGCVFWGVFVHSRKEKS